MRASGEHDMLEAFGLRLQGPVDLGVAVAMDIDPPGRDAVQDAPAVVRDEVRPVAANDRKRLRGCLHLGERMPDTGAVSCGERRHRASVAQPCSGALRAIGGKVTAWLRIANQVVARDCHDPADLAHRC